MNATAPKTDKPFSFNSFVRECLEDRGGDVKKTQQFLVTKFRHDESFRALVVEEAVESALRDRVSHQIGQQRNHVAKRAGKADVIALAEGFKTSLLNFPLRGGRPLADAKREEVQENAEYYERRSSIAGHWSRWLRLVAQATPPTKKVRDAVTTERLQELWTETENA